MGLGRFADENLLDGAVLTCDGGTTFSPSLSEAKTMPGTIAARSSRLGTHDSPVKIIVTLDERYPCTYAGLLYTNLRQSANYRLQLYADDAKTNLLLDTRDADTGLDLKVVPGLTDPVNIRWGASNLFRQDLSENDFYSIPTHVHVPFDVERPKVAVWSIYGSAYKPDRTEANYYDIGFMFLSDSWETERDVESEDNFDTGDTAQSLPGGFTTIEPGTGHREAAIVRKSVARSERDEITLMTRRTKNDKTVVWIPDVDDLPACLLYGFVGRIKPSQNLGHRFFSTIYSSTTLVLREYIA